MRDLFEGNEGKEMKEGKEVRGGNEDMCWNCARLCENRARVGARLCKNCARLCWKSC